MKYRAFLAGLASFALMCAPLAAQANTRAAGSSVSLATLAGQAQAAGVAAVADLGREDCDNDGVVNSEDDDDDCGGGLAWLVFGGVGITVLALVFAAGGSGSSQGSGGGARSAGTGN